MDFLAFTNEMERIGGLLRTLLLLLLVSVANRKLPKAVQNIEMM